jgi:hypothetical protein
MDGRSVWSEEINGREGVEGITKQQVKVHKQELGKCRKKQKERGKGNETMKHKRVRGNANAAHGTG